MVGALACGLAYSGTRNLGLTCASEVVGTGILGGLAAWPIATLFLNKQAAVYAFVGPFLISTTAGALIAGAVLFALKRSGGLAVMQDLVRR